MSTNITMIKNNFQSKTKVSIINTEKYPQIKT